LREKRLKCLIRLHLRFPLCYAEAAMKTHDYHRPPQPRLCRSPKLTPARLAACRANARKWVAQTAAVAVCGLCDICRDFVPQTAVIAVFPHPQAKRRGPQKRRSALPSGEERMKTNRRCARNSGSYEDNLRFPIRAVAQTAAFAVCGFSPSPGKKTRTAETAVRPTGDVFSSPHKKTRTADEAVRATRSASG